jgi:uncharacterized protein YkwD
MHRMIVHAREANGLGGVHLSPQLSRKAHKHSRQMASSGSLFHSGGPVAENIGVGGNLRAIHDALMDSSSHRANILRSGVDRVGVGVVRRSGRVWVTELFAG